MIRTGGMVHPPPAAPTARKLCAWAGLTPTVRSSDGRTRLGHISRQGSRIVRWARRLEDDPDDEGLRERADRVWQGITNAEEEVRAALREYYRENPRPPSLAR